MSWFEEFRKAWADYPSQDNEGFVPHRGGFKCGFKSAWDKQQEKIDLLEAELNTAKEWERSSKPMYVKWNAELNDKLEVAKFRLKHIAENTECIGLEKCHVDGNCIHCLAAYRIENTNP